MLRCPRHGLRYESSTALGTHQPRAQHTNRYCNALQDLLNSQCEGSPYMGGRRWHRRCWPCLDQSYYAHLARTTHSANASAQACICRFHPCTCTEQKHPCLFPDLVLAVAAPSRHLTFLHRELLGPAVRLHTSACSSNASVTARWKTMESASTPDKICDMRVPPPCPG